MYAELSKLTARPDLEQISLAFHIHQILPMNRVDINSQECPHQFKAVLDNVIEFGIFMSLSSLALWVENLTRCLLWQHVHQ